MLARMIGGCRKEKCGRRLTVMREREREGVFYFSIEREGRVNIIENGT